MPASVLQTYLRLNLLELGGDDFRLQKLGLAASKLADSFARAPSDALPVFLATLRSDQEVGDALTEVADAIESQWTTYHGAFQGGTAITLYRAVALQALMEALDMQPVLGTAISLLMRNFGPRLEAGKNKPALDLLVDAADAAFATESEEAMARLAVQKFIVPAVVKPTKLDRAALQKRIDTAVGPHDRAGQAGNDPNLHWTSAGTPWSYDFSDRLTALLADYLDNVVSRASDMDARNLGALGNKFKEVTTQSDTELKRATSLLWWRQALYSESAKQPYRELQLIDAVVHVVIDLSALIPAAYERALESFLTEAILSLLPPQDEIAQNELLKVASKASSLLSGVLESEAPAGLLLSAIVKNDNAATIIRASLPPQKWAVWLLRELKALQALENPKLVPEKKDSDDE
ncbi:MAG: GTPase-associated system all-helical protein GASH [Dehalococcoidales bacterium]|nr:GTPase-associated system all-helical protein GASH [Dehalococcoidales bacterium]